MIKIANDQLPQSFLSYIAFRTAFLDTMERICWTLQFETQDEDRFGFLTEVPFLRGVPPHIQLDLLATTWWKHISPDRFSATLVDEAIVYSACELSARIVEEDPAVMARFLKKGPAAVDVAVDQHLATALRDLHLKLSNDGDFLLIGQFSDMPPDEAARLKEKFNFDVVRAESMFEALGRWQISSNFPNRVNLLLSPDEIPLSFDVMQQKMTRCWQRS